MTTQILETREGFQADADVWSSFAGVPSFCRIGGPLRLVRLMQAGRSREGKYWFQERVFNRLKQRAETDLARQAKSNPQPFRASRASLIGLYMKLCLRSDLAISKDWTGNFDAYVVLPLGPTDSVVALVGRIKDQPYYSEPKPGSPDYDLKKKQHEMAEAAGVSLLALEDQYVIDFSFPANVPLKNKLQGPVFF